MYISSCTLGIIIINNFNLRLEWNWFVSRLYSNSHKYPLEVRIKNEFKNTDQFNYIKPKQYARSVLHHSPLYIYQQKTIKIIAQNTLSNSSHVQQQSIFFLPALLNKSISSICKWHSLTNCAPLSPTPEQRRSKVAARGTVRHLQNLAYNLQTP